MPELESSTAAAKRSKKKPALEPPVAKPRTKGAHAGPSGAQRLVAGGAGGTRCSLWGKASLRQHNTQLSPQEKCAGFTHFLPLNFKETATWISADTCTYTCVYVYIILAVHQRVKTFFCKTISGTRIAKASFPRPHLPSPRSLTHRQSVTQTPMWVRFSEMLL